MVPIVDCIVEAHRTLTAASEEGHTFPEVVVFAMHCGPAAATALAAALAGLTFDFFGSFFLPLFLIFERNSSQNARRPAVGGWRVRQTL